MRMLNQTVLLIPEKEISQYITKFVIPSIAPKNNWYGIVTAVADNVPDVDIGDMVVYDPHGKTEVTLQGIKHIVVTINDILAVERNK